jgi:ubiquinone/menaquinone biosynthesis C-methylase UbiE
MTAPSFDRLVELHRTLPRQGPGSRKSTRRALDLVPDLPDQPRIVDLGCGSGAQTLDLLDAVEGATVVAVDRSAALLDELGKRARAAGVSDRLTLVEGDMTDLPGSVHRAWFHLVWSEGAAYVMGFDAALRAWRHLLVPGGFIGVSELTWLTPPEDVDEGLRAFWNEEYPAMRSNTDNQAAFEACGYELSGSFVLPASDWWDAYYGPLLKRLRTFEKTHSEDEASLALVRATRREIGLFHDHPSDFGYVFYVGRMR